MNLPAASELAEHDMSPQANYYAELVARVRRLISSCVPPEATVAVVSKGDGDLLRLLPGCIGWHFPRAASGAYAGHHPADDADAIARLEATHTEGAEFLVFPATAYWWLDYYAGFKRYLDSRYERVADQADTGIIYSLLPRVASAEESARRSHEAFVGQVRDVATGLLPAGARVVVATGGDQDLLDLGSLVCSHFPQLAGGYYAGADPADSDSAVAHLEALRVEGAEYLIIPRSAHWWLDHFVGLRAHLQQASALVTRQENVCTIYDLREPTSRDAVQAASSVNSQRPAGRHGPRRGPTSRRSDA